MYTLSFSGIGMGWPLRKEVKTPFLFTGILGSCILRNSTLQMIIKTIHQKYLIKYKTRKLPYKFAGKKNTRRRMANAFSNCGGGTPGNWVMANN